MNLFVIMSVAGDLKLQTAARGVLPFLGADVVRLALLVSFPGLSLWLPGMMA
jgi:TRAP-type C4-dicarboxylate transport system permease large subunit